MLADSELHLNLQFKSEWNLWISLGKLEECLALFVIFCSHFSKGFDSHVSLFCFFSVSDIVPLITCYDLQFKNMFKKSISSFMYFSYSAFQILLQILVLFNFLSVICNLITVNVLIVSCCQTIVWVLLLITLKECNHLKRDWN